MKQADCNGLSFLEKMEDIRDQIRIAQWIQCRNRTRKKLK